MSTTGIPALHMVHIVGATMQAQSSHGVDRKVVEEMATILALSDERTIELHRDIHATREQLEIWQDFSKHPRGTATARRLERIEKSLARIAREAERAIKEDDPQWRIALRAMTDAGEMWAAKQQSQDLEDLGFEPMKHSYNDGHSVDYGTDIVIDRWLALAPVMFQLMKKAKEQLAGDTASEQQDWPGAMEWLVGRRLPELYEKFSDLAFRVERKDGEVVENDAVMFVNDALEAMRLGTISPHTVATHISKYARRIRTD